MSSSHPIAGALVVRLGLDRRVERGLPSRVIDVQRGGALGGEHS
jgi:hypothetical protein